MKRILFFLVALMLVLFLTSAQAQVPREISYQGILLGSDEQPVPEGNYKITFNLYDPGNTLLWTEVHDPVFVAGGQFEVYLGSITPLNVAFDQPYFLGIQVGNDPELQPRMFFGSVPYSIRADDANKVGGISVSPTPEPEKLLPLDSNGKFPASVLPAGSPGGNFLRKNEPDTTKGSSSADMLRIENTGSGRGLTVMSSGAHGILGKSSSNQAGVEGENSGTGAGVRGSSQSHHGTIGYTNANDKAGVYGNSNNGIGVWGNSISNHGVYGQSTNGRGVTGKSTAAGKSGVYGESTQGLGVEGRSNANDGVVGWTNNPQNSGVFGNSPNGIGVTGRSAGNDGLLGVSTSSNPGHAGVHARNGGAGPAVYSEGDLFVTGGFRGNIGPNGGAPFPKPAYDSGWVSIAYNENKVLTHNLGGSADNYVVDLQFKTQFLGIHNSFIGWDTRSTGVTWGARWHHLTTSSITVERASNDGTSPVVRVRIWVYK